MTQFLTTSQLVRIAERLTGRDFAVRDLGLLEAAAARPATTVFGKGAYVGLPEKAAALFHSIVTSRPVARWQQATGMGGGRSLPRSQRAGGP